MFTIADDALKGVAVRVNDGTYVIDMSKVKGGFIGILPSALMQAVVHDHCTLCDPWQWDWWACLGRLETSRNLLFVNGFDVESEPVCSHLRAFVMRFQLQAQLRHGNRPTWCP